MTLWRFWHWTDHLWTPLTMTAPNLVSSFTTSVFVRLLFACIPIAVYSVFKIWHAMILHRARTLSFVNRHLESLISILKSKVHYFMLRACQWWRNSKRCSRRPTRVPMSRPLSSKVHHILLFKFSLGAFCVRSIYVESFLRHSSVSQTKCTACTFDASVVPSCRASLHFVAFILLTTGTLRGSLYFVFAGANGKFSGGADIRSLQTVKKGKYTIFWPQTLGVNVW